MYESSDSLCSAEDAKDRLQTQDFQVVDLRGGMTLVLWFLGPSLLLSF